MLMLHKVSGYAVSSLTSAASNTVMHLEHLLPVIFQRLIVGYRILVNFSETSAALYRLPSQHERITRKWSDDQEGLRILRKGAVKCSNPKISEHESWCSHNVSIICSNSALSSAWRASMST